MRKLLSANFMRLWKSKVLWLAFAAVLALSAASMLSACGRVAAGDFSQPAKGLDDYYYSLMPVLGLFCAAFTSLFLGTEFSDGAIRNKLVVGHGRMAIYFSNFLTCSMASLLLLGALLLGGLSGISTLGPWRMEPAGVLCYFLVAILSTLALSAIFTFLAMAFTVNRAAGAVVSLLFFLGLLVCAITIYNLLCQPEMYSGMHITAEGIVMGDPEPNPSYVDGFRRVVYQFLVDFLPTGQGVLLANLEVANPLRMALSSVFITVAVTFGGAFLFTKRDLK